MHNHKRHRSHLKEKKNVKRGIRDTSRVEGVLRIVSHFFGVDPSQSQYLIAYDLFFDIIKYH